MPAPLNLDALLATDRLPRVVLFGRELTVRPITGAQAHALATAQDDATGTAMLAALLRVVEKAVPGLTADEVEALTIEQLGAIVALTRGGVAEVEAQLAQGAPTAEVAAGN
jgi:hypothetical protein